MPRTRLHQCFRKEPGQTESIFQLQDDGLERFPKRKTDCPGFIFSFLDSDIYGRGYGLGDRQNEESGPPGKQILLPSFDRNGSEGRGTGLKINVLNEENKGMNRLCKPNTPSCHRVTKASAGHRLHQEAKHLHRSGIKYIPLH